MDCREARERMETGGSGAAAPALAAHVASCESCRRLQHEVDRLTAALAALPREAPVHAGIEARTMRGVHDALDAERRRRPWRLLARWLPAPALAALAVAVIVSWWPAPGDLSRPLDAPVAPLARRSPPPDAPGTRMARVEREDPPVPAAPEVADEGAARVLARALGEPPPELAQALDMYLELPILEHMEKLQHFEVIQTTEVNGDRGHSG